MAEDQARYVRRPTRSWRDPSPVERLKIIQDQIALNDKKPTDPNWQLRDLVLRTRESALLVEIETLKNATS